MSEVVCWLSSDEEEDVEPQPPAPPHAHSHFLQLRNETNSPRRWAVSFSEMLEPAETATHVLLSTFGAAHIQLDELRGRLEAMCRRCLTRSCVSRWRKRPRAG